MLGVVSGKVGNVVCAKWKDQMVIRKAPRKRRSKPGELEKKNWSDFAILHHWLRPIISYLRVGFNGWPGRAHAFNAAKSLGLKNAFVGNKGERVLDPSLVQVSWGDLSLPSDITVSKTGDRELTFNWNATSSHHDQYDQAMLLTYDPETRHRFIKLTGQFRNNGTDKLLIGHEGNYHVYIAFVAADRSRQSVSQYLGCIEVS